MSRSGHDEGIGAVRERGVDSERHVDGGGVLPRERLRLYGEAVPCDRDCSACDGKGTITQQEYVFVND